MLYPYIVAWGRYMGSFQYYIDDQQLEAQQDNAPQTAVYKKDRVWVTFDELPEIVQARLEVYLPKAKH